MKPTNFTHNLIAALIICCAGFLLAGPAPDPAPGPAASAVSTEAPLPSEVGKQEEQIKTRVIVIKDGEVDIDEDEVLQNAHKELQRALEKIKLHHLRELPEDLHQFKWVSEGDRPRLGILFDAAGTKNSKEGLGIIGITPGSPAEEGGLKAGDIITKIDELELDGDPESDIAKVLAHLAEFQAGETVHVIALRDGNTRESDLKLGEASGDKEVRMLFVGDDDSDFDFHGMEKMIPFLPGHDLDLELASLNEGLAEYFGTSEGILVLDTSQENSLGLKAGDVIQHIGGRELRGPEHAFRIFRSYEPNEEMKLQIIRHGKSLELKGAKK